ncbi:MAG: hypothetical protein O7G31_06195, partial [Calditrichaeota bacterium]|nr:hypothetical protein [Calditrichota bacterium]
VRGCDRRNAAAGSPDRITIRDTSDKCTLVIGEDGKTRSKGTGRDITTFLNRVAFLRSCAVKGASLGSNLAAKAAAWKKFIAFAGKYSG